MSVALAKPMSLEAFLAWEERQDARFEFDGFGPVAMTGGTRAHETIGGNVRAEVRDRLRGGPCQVFGPTLKIQIGDRIRYPDAFVVCSPGDPRSTVVHDPIVVFEVLSDSTARTDMVAKLGEYAAASSIRRYVILQQNFIGGLNLTRNGDHFVAEPLDHDAVLAMPELGIEIPVTAFYEGLEYPPVDDDVDSQNARR